VDSPDRGSKNSWAKKRLFTRFTTQQELLLRILFPRVLNTLTTLTKAVFMRVSENHSP
jgi:hypothetical protein